MGINATFDQIMNASGTPQRAWANKENVAHNKNITVTNSKLEIWCDLAIYYNIFHLPLGCDNLLAYQNIVRPLLKSNMHTLWTACIT